MTWELPIGAQPTSGGVRFRVWAEDARQVEVVVLDEGDQEIASHLLERDPEGYFEGRVSGLEAGARYMYRLDGDKLRPDPASRYQPEGAHGPSQVVDPGFAWTDGRWAGVPLEELVIYEMHTGTATPEGTFEALIGKLPYLRDLGVTAVEIMPVADFPGNHNWGYDGVALYAPARAYGGHERSGRGLKRLVDAAHGHGLAVILDVVYNHLGPDGNYLRDFSKAYFTGAKKTPWGDALNFGSRPVREFFINNAVYWAQEYHIDGLRLDATHAILDDSTPHILEELAARVRAGLPEERRFVITAEDERNKVLLITPVEAGGIGLDAVWADDFHHQVRRALAGDHEGYYADYTGSAADLAETLDKGWFFRGQRSEWLKAPRGTDASMVDHAHFIYCIQNHDQVGNRALGDRLTASIGPAAYRAASALLLLGPGTPLLFQGQEWAASTPFLYFTDHNSELGQLVTKGRREEFSHFKGFGGAEVPDPQAESTFRSSKLDWSEVEQPGHRETLALYRELLHLRRSLPALKERRRDRFGSAYIGGDAIAMRYSLQSQAEQKTENRKQKTEDQNPRSDLRLDLLVIANLKGELALDLAANEITCPPEGHIWRVVLSTDEMRFGGPQDEAEVLRLAERNRLSADGPLVVALQATRV